MCKATLGLELEYSDFKVTLKKKDVADSRIDESSFKSKHIIINRILHNDSCLDESSFKSKHIIITDDEKKDDKVKQLFSDLGDYGINVTLDTRSQHAELKGEVPLTIELVLNHEEFVIDNSRCIKDREILLSKSFADQVNKFSDFLMRRKKEILLEIRFEGQSDLYELKIPLYNGNRQLMPHITIPCPLYRIGNPGKNPPYEWEKTKERVIPEYSVDYLIQILNSLKVLIVSKDRALTSEELNLIEKHDPKQSYGVIPKTSFNAIFSMIKKKYPNCLKEEENAGDDYYITKDITYKSLIKSIISDDNDLLKDNLIGIGSMGPKFEYIWNEKCPIFEFRNIGSFDSAKISLFEQKLKDDLLHLYIGNRTPFYFTGIK